KVLPEIRYDRYQRALCVLDPYNLNPDWEIVRLAGQSGTIEIFLNFMVMDLKMNIHLGNPDNVMPSQVERMNRFWGDESWRDVGYAPDPQMDLFAETGVVKLGSFALVDAYRKRLKDIAGFRYVPEPIPMKNSTGAEVYYLFFASPNATGNKIVEDILEKYRRNPLPDRVKPKGKR
ncbi:MAG: three-Cys-motif partner protein TcmP, partial [bacterium]